jgi:hypothetical protein
LVGHSLDWFRDIKIKLNVSQRQRLDENLTSEKARYEAHKSEATPISEHLAP